MEDELSGTEAVILLECVEQKLRRFEKLGADYFKLIVCQEGWREWVGLEIKAVQTAIEVLKNRK